MDKSRQNHDAQIKSLLIKLLERDTTLWAPIKIKVLIKRLLFRVTVKGLVKRPCGEPRCQSRPGTPSEFIHGK